MQHGSQTATALSMTGTAEIEVWNGLYESMDFQSWHLTPAALLWAPCKDVAWACKEVA